MMVRNGCEGLSANAARLIEEAVRIEQGQGSFAHAQKKLGRQCDAHGIILETETTL